MIIQMTAEELKESGTKKKSYPESKLTWALRELLEVIYEFNSSCEEEKPMKTHQLHTLYHFAHVMAQILEESERQDRTAVYNARKT